MGKDEECQTPTIHDRDFKEYADLPIDVYSQALRGNLVSRGFVEGARARKAKGQVTTFYVCNIPAKPNTWMTSPFAEVEWMGLSAATNGLDGFLRWSCFNWGRDPFFDSHTADRFEPGESNLLYPEGRASVRWEMLRDSIENFEKIRVLRGEGPLSDALSAALKDIDFAKAAKDTPEGARQKVDAVLKEL